MESPLFVEALEGGLALYQNREELAGVFAKLNFLLRNGRVRIAVLGPGGTGKTTLGHRLSSGDDESAAGAYNVSPVTDVESLENVPFGVLFVAPGQARRRRAHWPKLLQAISAGKVKVVVFVGSWGLHSMDLDAYSQHPLFKEGMSKDDFLAIYTAASRQEELTALLELAPHLKASSRNPLWMITLVAKQDLWWHQRAAVREFYESGEYARVIEEVRVSKGDQAFVHEFHSASLEMVNLSTRLDGVLVPTVGGYDERIQGINLDRFCSALYSFLDG